MRIVLIMALMVMGAALCGCASPFRINEIAAEAMLYSKLERTTADHGIKEAIRQITGSDPHREIRRVLASLPTDVHGCLIIEAAEYSKSTKPEDQELPVIFIAFEGDELNGFISNFGFDDDGQTTESEYGWRAAVWPVKAIDGSYLPQNPLMLLPSGTTRPAEERRLFAIITLVDRRQINTVAGWIGEEDVAPGNGRTILHTSRFHVLKRLCKNTQIQRQQSRADH